MFYSTDIIDVCNSLLYFVYIMLLELGGIPLLSKKFGENITT